MNSEAKQCQSCKQDFSIEPADFDFYRKIDVPPPTFYWKCRLARRLVWRNERSLYKRACDLCHKNVISMYPAEAPFPVYCHDCWWGDSWSPVDYGREYDFQKPFFEQFADLQKVVPKPAAYATGNVNSDYCNYTAHMKEGYLMFGSWFSENCGYGQTVLESKDCWDCMFVKNCELCLSSVDCTKCNQTHFSQKCSDCFASAFLYDCKNCQNCLFCFNLRGKSYHIFNQPVSREEFEKTKKEIMGSFTALQKARADFQEMARAKAIHKSMTGDRNNNASGEFIYNSKNVQRSYYIHDGENEKYAVRGGKGQKDAMDVFGVHAGELAYECNNIDFSSRCLFSINGENNINSDYLADSFNVKNSFGCISLRQKEYCILNKQYDEKTVKELREKIITHMSAQPYVDQKGRTYAYGELFPIEIAPSAYNETLAQEYLPLTAERAVELGYAWHAIEDKSYTASKNWKDLPDTIGEVDDAILSEVVLCQAWDSDKKLAQEHKCSKAFKITPNELAMYRKWNTPLPRQCPNTRNFELFQLRNPVDFWPRHCQCSGNAQINAEPTRINAETDNLTQPLLSKERSGEVYRNTVQHFHGAEPCPNEFETSYAPERPEIIYCESCYNAEVV
ncbi:MAG: hypothetical protein HY978_01465 [Candidatus Liptonbacteria bacterium]|nr:hypothetical protein [Candidatus Liptonbacteria bacterium]